MQISEVETLKEYPWILNCFKDFCIELQRKLHKVWLLSRYYLQLQMFE